MPPIVGSVPTGLRHDRHRRPEPRRGSKPSRATGAIDSDRADVVCFRRAHHDGRLSASRPLPALRRWRHFVDRHVVPVPIHPVSTIVGGPVSGTGLIEALGGIATSPRSTAGAERLVSSSRSVPAPPFPTISTREDGARSRWRYSPLHDVDRPSRRSRSSVRRVRGTSKMPSPSSRSSNRCTGRSAMAVVCRLHHVHPDEVMQHVRLARKCRPKARRCTLPVSGAVHANGRNDTAFSHRDVNGRWSCRHRPGTAKAAALRDWTIRLLAGDPSVLRRWRPTSNPTWRTAS